MNTREAIDWQEVKARVANSQAATEQSRLATEPARLEQVYRDRARQFAARSAAGAAPADAWPALTFTVGAERLCIDLNALVEVLPCARSCPLPGSPPELLGVINVRGRVCSVLDLACILDVPASSDRAAGYIVLAQHAGVEVGLRVDNVEQIETVTPGELDDSLSDLVALSPQYVQGRVAGRVAVLDIEAVFSQFVWNSDPAAGTATLARPSRGRQATCVVSQIPHPTLSGDVSV